MSDQPSKISCFTSS